MERRRLVGWSTCALIMLFAWEVRAQADFAIGTYLERQPVSNMALGYYSPAPASPWAQPRDSSKQPAPAVGFSGTPWVMGMSEGSALHMSGDPYGNAFDHDHGDIANRWAHASVVAMARETLRGAGVSSPVAALIGASLFIPKELLIDDNPSASDFALDLELHRQTHGLGVSSVSVTVFGDGAVFLGMWRTF